MPQINYNSVKMDKRIVIEHDIENNTMSVVRRYRCYNNGKRVNDIIDKKLKIIRSSSDVPLDVRSVVMAIDNYTFNEAKTLEGVTT